MLSVPTQIKVAQYHTELLQYVLNNPQGPCRTCRNNMIASSVPTQYIYSWHNTNITMKAYSLAISHVYSSPLARAYDVDQATARAIYAIHALWFGG